MLYSEFSKLSREPIKFDLVFNFLTIKQEEQKKQEEINRKNSNITYLNKYYKDGQIAQITNVVPKKSLSTLGGTINSKEKVI